MKLDRSTGATDSFPLFLSSRAKLPVRLGPRDLPLSNSGTQASLESQSTLARSQTPKAYRVRDDKSENQARNRSPISDRSSFSSFTLASIFPRLNSLIATFCTTCGVPLFTRTGNEQIKPFSTPYSPLEQSATLCQSLSGVSVINERTVSTTAFAADAADDKPRALIIAAPRCCTVWINVSFNHLSSPITSFAARPLIPSRSFRSIPALRGTLPTSSAQFTSRNPSSRSAVGVIDFSKGNAQSCNSMTTPSSAPSAFGISMSDNATGCSGPNMAPEAILKTSEYPICPAAPVTATLMGET